MKRSCGMWPSSTVVKASGVRDQCSQSDPLLVPGELTDVTKHLDKLFFTVWLKIKDQALFHPVFLDPNPHPV